MTREQHLAADEKAFSDLCNNPKRILYRKWASQFGNSRHKGGPFYLSDLYEMYKKFAHNNWLFDYIIPQDRFCQYIKDEYNQWGEITDEEGIKEEYWTSDRNVLFWAPGDFLRGWHDVPEPEWFTDRLDPSGCDGRIEATEFEMECV